MCIRDRPYVIRQKIPREGVTGFDDVVYGHIEVNNSEMDDQILIKTCLLYTSGAGAFRAAGDEDLPQAAGDGCGCAR